MQYNYPSHYLKKTIGFEKTILSDIIGFQNEKIKQDFKLLLQSNKIYSNKKVNKLAKRSSNCSNKNGNLGNGPYFCDIYCWKSIKLSICYYKRFLVYD